MLMGFRGRALRPPVSPGVSTEAALRTGFTRLRGGMEGVAGYSSSWAESTA